MFKDIIEIDNTRSFEFLRYNVAFEDNNFSSLSELLKKVKINSDKIKGLLERVYNRHDYIPATSVNLKKLKQKIDKYNYVDLSYIKLFRPIGLISTYMELLTTIEVIQDDLLRIDERVLTPFLKWSGEVLNRPEKLSRITINKIIDFLPTDEFNERLNSLFDSNDTGDVANCGSLFESNRQIEISINYLNRLIAKQNQLPPKFLMKKVNTVSKRAEILVRRCKVTNDELCSKTSKQVMADVFYDIGTEMSLYGRVSYNLISTQTAIEDSVKKILAMN